MSSVVVSNDDGSSLSQDRTSTHAATSTSSLDSSSVSSAPILDWDGTAAAAATAAGATKERFPRIHNMDTMGLLMTSSNTSSISSSPKTSKKPAITKTTHVPLPNPLAHMNTGECESHSSTIHHHQQQHPSSQPRSFQQDQQHHLSSLVANNHTPFTVFYGPNEVVTVPVPDPLKTLFSDHRDVSTMNTTVPDFMYQLTKLLTEDNKDYIEWVDGVIKVHNPTDLAAHVLHKYFRHSKYSSFQRQLNYFGFRKIAGKGKLAPCTYVNESVTSDLFSLLTLKRITRANKPDAKDSSVDHSSTVSPSNPLQHTPVELGLESRMELKNVSTDRPWVQDTPITQKGTRKHKSHPDSNISSFQTNQSLPGIQTSSSLVNQSPSKRNKRSRAGDSTLFHKNHFPMNSDLVTNLPPVFTFLEPSQLGMEFRAGTSDGLSAAMRRESSLVHLAMIPQVASMTDLDSINARKGEGQGDDEGDDDDLEVINFMDFI